jgi:hypothetical protein
MTSHKYDTTLCEADQEPDYWLEANDDGWYQWKLTKPISYIQLNFVAVRTGATFEEVVGSFKLEDDDGEDFQTNT